LHTFVTLEFDEAEWSVSSHRRLIPCEMVTVAMGQEGVWIPEWI